MTLYRVTRNGQTQAGAASVPRSSSVNAVEALENPRKLLFRNAEAIILYLKDDVRRFTTAPDPHLTRQPIVSHRIVGEV